MTGNLRDLPEGSLFTLAPGFYICTCVWEKAGASDGTVRCRRVEARSHPPGMCSDAPVATTGHVDMSTRTTVAFDPLTVALRELE